MTNNSGEQLHRDVGQALAVEPQASLADDAHALRDADHQPRGVFDDDMARNRAVGLSRANEAGDEAFVGRKLRADAGADDGIACGQFHRAADHEAAAPSLDALGVLDIGQQNVADLLAAVCAPRRRAASTPARVRSRMRSLSNSAMEPSTWKRSRPEGVVVSRA